MASYRDLLLELSYEVGEQEPRVLAHLPFLIKEAENFLWGKIAELLPIKSQTVTPTQPTPLPSQNTLQVLRIETEDGELQRLPCGSVKGTGFFIEGQNITFLPEVPTKDITIFFREREEPLQDGDTDATKFFLGDGFALLKYAVLTKVFNKDKWAGWMQSYERELRELRERKFIEKTSYRGQDEAF